MTNAAPDQEYAAPATGIETVRVTPCARARIEAILAGETPGARFRISVEGGGCSGFQYKFSNDEDSVFGDVVLIDDISLPYMAGSEIDFVDELIGQSFKINNPNATASCGCGTSFTL